MKKMILPEYKVNEIIQMYNDGMSKREISKEIGISATVITRYLTENNISIRPSCSYRLYPFNEHYFDTVDCDEKAYWLGFLLADGHNNTSNGTITVALQEKDKEHLDLLNYCVESDRPLLYRDFHYDSESKGQNAYTLRLNSVHMSKQLNSIGMVPNKSLCLEYPECVGDDLLPSLLRGYIDGDGWVQQYRIGFMSSKDFCNRVQGLLHDKYDIETKVYDQNPNKYNKQTKVLDITNRKNILPLIELMFKDANGIYLRRKYERYDKWYFHLLNNSFAA